MAATKYGLALGSTRFLSVQCPVQHGGGALGAEGIGPQSGLPQLRGGGQLQIPTNVSPLLICCTVV